MMPYIYRLWGRVRLEHLQPWVEEWATEEMYAGIEGRGAVDAAYTTALILEYCKLTKTPYSGGAADILKCFDQIQRPLLYKLLEKAGMPARNLEPYKRFLESICVHNTVAGGGWGKLVKNPRAYLKATLTR